MMNIEFSNNLKQYCAFTDEGIVFRNAQMDKFYPYSCVSSIKWSFGSLQFQAEGLIYTFPVSGKGDKQKMKEAIATAENLMKTAVAAEMPDPDKDYRKVCKVCGHIFCYTGKDLIENEKLAKKANEERTMAALDYLFTSRVSGNQSSQRADNLKAQIVDYSKCPKCGSGDIADATDEDIERNKMQGTVIQQTSAADELKKFKELLDLGVITQEEFDAKKKQLLGL